MTSNVISAVTGVFDAIAEWFVGMIPDLTAIFYTDENGLSLLGILALCGLSISVVLLVVNIIISFFQFRG